MNKEGKNVRREHTEYILSFITNKNGAKIFPSFPQYTHQTSEVYKLHAALYIHY
jgi:hypothetical protein